MQRHRFYAQPAQIGATSITLDGDEAHHLTRVLRLGAGATVFVLDGDGAEFECAVRSVGRHSVELEIVSRLENTVESPLHLTLAQALARGDRFDMVVQKATELGVTRIVPLITAHSEIRRVEERSEQRLQRWERIAREAVKQCGRRRLVEIAAPCRMADYCAGAEAGQNLILSERGGLSLREAGARLSPVSRIGVCVAAEGGWSDDEIELAAAHRFLPVHLGARILRTETAGITAVALLQHLFGDMH